MLFEIYKVGMYVNNEVGSIIKDIISLERELKRKGEMLSKIITRLRADEDMLDTILNTKS